VTLSLAALLAIALASASRAADDAKPAGPLSSHKQTKIISIPVGEEKVKIHTFCVDPQGRLLCSCGGEQMVTKRTPEGFQAEIIKSSPGIRVVSPEGELLAEWPVDFTPQTVNVGPDGFVYCGGAGKIAKLTMDGRIVKLIDAPNTKEMPPLPDLPKEIKMTDAEVKEREERKQKLIEQVAAMRKEMTDLRTELMKDDQPKIDQLAKEFREKYRKNILTSESSVGIIKRFTPEGEFLGRVGRAEIIPGCKHVAIGVADNSKKVYMLDITRSHIVLMEPVKDKVEVAAQ
jgi:hypothetical protein